ncbi:MAG: UDP-N-acetylmuramoyl-L-alanine--D-glutamate ligase [Candidatus Gracilibacteria bacterium]|nr:UDP-N-acetylmuramoyl-L-alanine--D-glutamate ligase [Candidatus Gracilibacteria bacterium]
MKTKKIIELKNEKIAILGYGKEGKSTLSFLLKLSFSNITILDKNINIEKRDNINYILGDNYLDNLGEYKLIFKAPGVSPYNEKLLKYKNKLITQTQIFLDNYDGKVIGITGTKGKSTISTLTFELLKLIGYNVRLVGNIGNPVLEEINILNNEESKKYDYIIYELSSYMLEGINPKLYMGVLNNIYNCHLEWHNGRKNYENAKYGVIKNADIKFINYELINNELKSEGIIYFGEKGSYYYNKGLFYKNEQVVLTDKNIALQGDHNKRNISVVLGIIDVITSHNIDKYIGKINSFLSIFTGLPHRLENIGIYNGITFIDDGIAVTPEATIAAIKTYKQNIGTIILGGQDGDYNYTDLINTLKKYNIGNIILFPETGEKIFGDLSNHNYESEFILDGVYNPKIFKTRSMKSAIDFAFKNTSKGKICLLSNAAPSYNLWSGFIEKGLQYQNEVKNYSKI